MWGLELVVMLAMIGVNCVFAGYEIALASVTLARLQRLAKENRAGAKIALYMKQNMEASLAVVQLGITLVGAIAAAVGGAGAEESIAPSLIANLGVSEGMAEVLAIAIVVAPLTTVTIVFGELIPKVFALRNAELVCLTLSPFMRWFSYGVWPAVWLFETVVKGFMSLGDRLLKRTDAMKRETPELQELRASVALARASRLISHREEGIILGATELQSRPVRDAMLPAEYIATLDANASVADNLTLAHMEMHTRFPVAEKRGDLRTVIGYVNVKDIIALVHSSPDEQSIRRIIRPLPTVLDNEPLAVCLDRLLRERTHIALIRDGDERVVGMISLEDILEELVGEIEDEFDRLPTHITGAGSSWLAGGGVSLEQLKAATNIDLTVDDRTSEVKTLSEWILWQVEGDIRAGVSVERDDLRVVVRRVRRQRAQEAHLIPLEQG